jgi:hypothetical protein
LKGALFDDFERHKRAGCRNAEEREVGEELHNERMLLFHSDTASTMHVRVSLPDVSSSL